jgi:hypothetical protein
LKVFNNFLRLCIALPVKDGYRESYIWSKNRLAKTFSAPKFCGPSSALLLQKNLHVLKVKGDCVRLEKIVANPIWQVERKKFEVGAMPSAPLTQVQDASCLTLLRR